MQVFAYCIAFCVALDNLIIFYNRVLKTVYWTVQCLEKNEGVSVMPLLAQNYIKQ